MKTLKKAMSVLVSLLMIFTFALPAFADSATYTITAPATTHQYEIYQIFTGDLSEGILSNVKWGVNGTGTVGKAVDSTIITELTDVNSKSDREKLDVVERYAKLDSTPVETISNGATYSAVAGYYLIKDKDGSVSGTSADTYTTYIVMVVGNVTITPKGNVPSFEKKVKDINDTTDTDASAWQDSADYDIGDKVPFKLEGTVASNYADYKTYYFAFHDKAEAGLTFDADSVKVYVGSTLIPSTGYQLVTSTTDGDTFDVVFDNLKNIADVKANSKITVEYTATLNDKAVLGNQGNVNTAHLEFSNNPNEEQNGSNKPETGSTPDDSVIVFTYQVVVNKTKANGDALSGAEFTLEKVLKNGTKETVTVVKNTEGTTFTFKGLDDGDYILTETVTPATYNTIEPIEFTVTADHNIVWDGVNRTGVLIGLTGNTADGKVTFTASADKSELTTNVINQSGATLPGTGGIGTTIFYVIGGLLMAAAAVLLITKKRMNSDK